METYKYIKVIITCLLSFFTVVAFSNEGFAENVPSGIIIGDERGLRIEKNGEYLINIDNVMPGKSWEKTISIVNMEESSLYNLDFMISQTTASGSLDLSKALQMIMTYRGEVIYSGPASGISKNKNLQVTPENLGTFVGGDSRALNVKFSLSGEYTNEDFSEKNIFECVWTFTAVKKEMSQKISNDKKIKKLLPMTGEQIRQVIVFFCLGLFFILIILLGWKARQTGGGRNEK